MFNNKTLQKVTLFLQPYLVGYGAGFLARYLSGMHMENAFLYLKLLTKTSIVPPAYVFPIVWFVFYTFIGYAANRVIGLKETSDRNIAMLFNQLQLFLNFLWVILYFGLSMPLWAFVDILLLIGSVAVMMFYYWKIDEVSFYMMLPYLGWLGFAAYLNYLVI